jgi:D-arabinan exo alpha-(1,3)/(1,5)-arabinofuranosidase (non-reducing end)
MKKLFLFLGVFYPISLLAQLSGNDMFSIAQIKNGIKSKRISSYDTTGGNNDRLENIRPGEKRLLFNVKGAGIINHIWITIAPGPENLKRDDIVIRMYWDNNESASVESPLGSFFGQGWNESYPFYSQPLNATPGGAKALVSYFIMPFEKGARIEIENQAEKPIEAFYYFVDYYEMEKLPAEMGRFHAWYNRELMQTNNVERENEWGVLGPQKNNDDTKRNYLIADIKGKGQFVGVNYYVHSPTPIWYGEGDDMIFIDGRSTPMLNGTGTEDYFNTSWSPKEPFMTPYFGYPRVNTNDQAYTGNGWLGRTHVYRFNIVDPIYFDKSLRFTIEHGHNNVLILDLRSVAYWYQSQAAGVSPIRPKKEREPMPMITPVDIHKWRDAWRKSKGDATGIWGNEQ